MYSSERERYLLAKPGVIKARSYSEWSSQGLSDGTPDGPFKDDALLGAPLHLLHRAGCRLLMLAADWPVGVIWRQCGGICWKQQAEAGHKS